MGKDKDGESDDAKMLLIEASKLGFEIGYLGHMEGIGWVKKKIREMEDKASELGVLDEMVQKYSLSKELGRKRRLQTAHISDVRKAATERKTTEIHFEELPSTLVIDTTRDIDRKLFGHFMRTSTKDSLSALANLMKMSDESHWVKRQVDTALSGVADIHDILGDIGREGGSEKTLEDGLNRIKEIGWISDFSIKEIKEETKVIHIEAISLVPELYGSGPNPICKNLSLALETIAGKALNAPVQVIEKKCICQGEERCKFVILPKEPVREIR